MICPHCQFDNAPGVRFCGRCGAALGTGVEDATRTAGSVGQPDHEAGTRDAHRSPDAPPPLVELKELELEGASETLLWDRFRVLEQLGSGGMGTVYRCADMKLEDQEVAIKLLPEEHTRDEQARARIKREVLSARALRHPNIVGVYEYFEGDGSVGFSMEYLSGHTLEEHLEGNVEGSPFTGAPDTQRLAWVAYISRGLAAALDHMHAQDLVHRDVKPSNVMLVPGTQEEPYIVKLLDLGIVHAMGGAGLTHDLQPGTVEFMAPELLSGRGKPSVASDVFSLGKVLYFGLTGTRPEFGYEPTPPSKVVEGLSEDVDGPIISCFGRPENRPSSAGELAQALIRVADRQRHADEAARRQAEEEQLRRERAEAERQRVAEEAQRRERELAEQQRRAEQARAQPVAKDSIREPSPPPRSRAWIAVTGASMALIVLALCGGVASWQLGWFAADPIPAPELPRLGKLILDIEPPEASDAAVLLDGEPIEVPYDQLGPDREYQLRVSKEGFEPYEEIFQVAAGEALRLRATLVAVVAEAEISTPPPEEATPEPPPVETPPAIVFRSTPRGAQVVIEGEVVGTTPYRLRTGEPGTTVFATLKLEGHHDEFVSMTFPETGTVYSSRYEMQVPHAVGRAWLRINATPWADVYVDGEHVGQTPISSLEVEPGTYTVRLVCPPLEAEQTKTVTVGFGDTKEVWADLEE